MANGHDIDYLGAAWDVVKVALAAIGSVASAAMLYLAKNWHGHLAMLKRHEEHINQNDKAMGELLAHRKSTGEELDEIISGLRDDMKNFEQENDRLHQRINKRELEQAGMAGDIKAINENIEWIKKTLERMQAK